MAAGLQVWDAQGVQILDTSTFVGRFLASVNIGTGTSGSFVVAGLSQGIPFAIPVIVANNSSQSYLSPTMLTMPVCTYSGDTVNWTRIQPGNSSGLPSCTLIVGYK